MVDTSMNYAISDKDDCYFWLRCSQTQSLTIPHCSNEWSRYARILKWDIQQNVEKFGKTHRRCFNSHLENATEYYTQYCTDHIVRRIKTEDLWNKLNACFIVKEKQINKT